MPTRLTISIGLAVLAVVVLLSRAALAQDEQGDASVPDHPDTTDNAVAESFLASLRRVA